MQKNLKMKIDFHTHYVEKEFEGLCEKAISLGLDALVMTGLNDNKDRNYKSLKIFPAQEVDWMAVLEIPYYKSFEDFKVSKKEKEEVKIFKGKALILLPQKKSFLKNYDSRLYDLLQEVSEFGGVTISLHDDENWPITLAEKDYKKIYDFSAIRIRPFNSHDINSEIGPDIVSVTGSNAHRARDLGNRSSFTYYKGNIKSIDDLIEVIKNKNPNFLYVSENGSYKKIEETVEPLKFIIGEEDLSRIFRG